MELAKMNGTLKEGAFSGMGWLKEENNTLTNQTVCTVCGGRGHLASDCKQARPGTTHDFTKTGKRVAHENKAQMDSEYTALMAELGETVSAPIQIATPSLGTIGNNQMATHGVGGSEVLQAIEYNPEKGTKAGGKLNKDEVVEDLENGNWDPKNYGYAGGDYTTGQADLAESEQPLAFSHIGDKKQKRLTEKDIHQVGFDPEIMMEVNGQPIFKNQLMRAQETEEVDKYLQNKTFRNPGTSTGSFS